MDQVAGGVFSDTQNLGPHHHDGSTWDLKTEHNLMPLGEDKITLEGQTSLAKIDPINHMVFTPAQDPDIAVVGAPRIPPLVLLHGHFSFKIILRLSHNEISVKLR